MNTPLLPWYRRWYVDEDLCLDDDDRSRLWCWSLPQSNFLVYWTHPCFLGCFDLSNEESSLRISSMFVDTWIFALTICVHGLDIFIQNQKDGDLQIDDDLYYLWCWMPESHFLVYWTSPCGFQGLVLTYQQGWSCIHWNICSWSNQHDRWS